MRKYNVVFDIFNGEGQKITKTITVEAGNKKMAVIRAFGELTMENHGEYEGLFKQVAKVEEVA